MNEKNEEKPIARKNLLVSIAKMYYLQHMTQQEIAEKVFLSRSNVSRLLKMCVDQHIVEFYINETSSIGHELQERLKAMYSLRDVIVIPSQSDKEQTKQKLGEAVVMYLRAYLKTGISFGVAWGTTLYHISTAFKPIPDVSIDVVQLVGGMGAKSLDTDGAEIAKRIAKNLNGNAYVPYVPYIVKDLKLKQMLLREPEIHEHFERAKNVDIALVGIGASTKTLSSSARAGYITEHEIAMQIDSGAVCDICGIQLDQNGKSCAEQFDKKRIGISYNDLKKIPAVIGVAVGMEKTDALLSALKSGLVHTLAIDEAAAFSVLGRAATKI